MKLIDTNKVLVLSETIAKANRKSENFKLLHDPIDRTPMVKFDDGKIVTFSWEHLINLAIQFKKDQE